MEERMWIPAPDWASWVPSEAAARRVSTECVGLPSPTPAAKAGRHRKGGAHRLRVEGTPLKANSQWHCRYALRSGPEALCGQWFRAWGWVRCRNPCWSGIGWPEKVEGRRKNTDRGKHFNKHSWQPKTYKMGFYCHGIIRLKTQPTCISFS